MANTEDGDGKEPAPPCSADVQRAYEVVAGAMEKVFTVLDVGFSEVFGSHEGLTGMSGRAGLNGSVQSGPKM